MMVNVGSTNKSVGVPQVHDNQEKRITIHLPIGGVITIVVFVDLHGCA